MMITARRSNTLRARTAVLGAGVIALAGSLVGCSMGGTFDPVAAPSAPATPPAAATATPEAEAITSPPPSPVETAAGATPASCDTALTEAEYASLEADGLVPTDFVPQSWDYPILQTIADEGLVCLWAGQGDVSVVLGQLPLDEAEWTTTRDELLAQGFVEDDASAPGFLNGPDAEDESYASRGVVYRDGLLYYVSYPALLSSLA